jgi:hypothetical protein
MNEWQQRRQKLFIVFRTMLSKLYDSGKVNDEFLRAFNVEPDDLTPKTTNIKKEKKNEKRR